MRRGRPPKPIDPDESCGHRLGFELRRARMEKDLTLEALADRVGCTPQHVSGIEHAETCPSEDLLVVLDRVLETGGRLLGLYPDVLAEHARARQRRARRRREGSRRDALPCVQEVEDVKRREFIGLGLAVVLLGPDAANASADDWDRIAHQWTREVAAARDRQALLPGLRADLRRLAEAGGPQRAVARLSVCAAMIALSGGDPATARRWWSRAHVAARADGDRVLRAYVAGQHAYDGVYALYTPAQALTLADRAVAVTSAPCAGRMHALSARPRALGLLGRRHEATTAMNDLERAFGELPSSVVREPVGGWGEVRLHTAASFVLAYGEVGSSASHDHALAADEGFWRDGAQIELQRSASEVDPQLAESVLKNLSRDQRGDQFVRRLARRTLTTLEARGADTRELSEILS